MREHPLPRGWASREEVSLSPGPWGGASTAAQGSARGGRGAGALQRGDRGTVGAPAPCKDLSHHKPSKLSGHRTWTKGRPLPVRAPLQGYAVGVQGTLLTLYQTTII